MTEYTKVVIEADDRGRMSISAMDDQGVGGGYRLAGPKFCGCCPGKTTARAELDERDVREIRSYLDTWDKIHTREPRVFSSDDPEPPEDVKVLTDGDDDMGFLVRHPDGWVWRDDPKFDPEDSCLAERWKTVTHPVRNVSPELREVLDV